MRPSSDPVTQTTPVLPRPTNPPINFGPRLRREGRTPPPGPDIKIMVPQAAEQVQSVNKLETEDERAAAELSGGGDYAPDWRLYDLFLKPSGTADVSRSWPIADAFTLYLMAVLSRFTYMSPGPLFDQAREALLSVLGAEWTYQKVTDLTDPAVRYDQWLRPGASQIIAIQGTTVMQEWLEYSAVSSVPVGAGWTDVRAYHGIDSLARKYTARLTNPVTGVSPGGPLTILTGHSVGGAIAQLATGIVHEALRVQDPTSANRKRIVAQYTYGAPAWMGEEFSTAPTGWLDEHCRCYLPQDPVPFSTQVYANQFAGIGIGLALLSSTKNAGVAGFRHISNKSIELETLGVQDRAESRGNIVKALSTGNERLTQLLIKAHSMSTYTAACFGRCHLAKQTPEPMFSRLVLADRLMDRADGIDV